MKEYKKPEIDVTVFSMGEVMAGAAGVSAVGLLTEYFDETGVQYETYR